MGVGVGVRADLETDWFRDWISVRWGFALLDGYLRPEIKCGIEKQVRVDLICYVMISERQECLG